MNKTRKTIIALFTVLVGLLAVTAQAHAGQARIIADQATATALGDRGITPDVTSPADLVLDSSGRPLAIFPTIRSGKSVRLRGGLSLRRGGTSVEIRGLQLKGKVIYGVLGSKSRKVLYLTGVNRTRKKVTFTSARMSRPAASILRQKFTDSVFKAGMRFFRSGSIPLG